MKVSHRSTRLRSVAASAGGLALAGALALSGAVGGGPEMTEAVWNDTEVAQATIKAEWSNGGWARATSNAYSNHESYKYRSYVLRQTPLTRSNKVDSGGTSLRSSWEDWNDDGLSPNFEVRTFGLSRSNTNVSYCAQAAAASTPAGSQTNCTTAGNGPSYTLAAQTRAKGWGRAGGYANPRGPSTPNDYIMWMEADTVQTMAECSADGNSRAYTPTANSPGSGNSIGIISSLSKTTGLGYADSWFTPMPLPAKNKRITRWIQPKYADGATGISNGDVDVRVTITSRAYSTAGYAISDLYATLDQYSRRSNREYLGSFTVVFSRSECAVSTPSRNFLPLATTFEKLNPPAYQTNPPTGSETETPAPLPLPDGSLAYADDVGYPLALEPKGFASDGPGTGQLARAMREGDPVAAELPPTTTLTSPLEDTTASETTASAPPNPSGDGESTTPGTSTVAATASTRRPATSTVPTVSAAPTSAATTPSTQATTSTAAAPANVIPDEPGTLSPTARIEDVGIVDGGGEDLIAVATGDTIPADARTALVALDTWIEHGEQPGGDWKTFSSTDPGTDGWRWAAINQETGTVVYIR